MMPEPVPRDDELWDVLAEVCGGDLLSIDRSTYRYATSHALEELRLHLRGANTLTVIFKDLGWDRMLPEATGGKPRLLHEPRREIETYRTLLDGEGIGPRCHAAVTAAGRHWLILEKVPGVELWQTGDLDVWEAVAAWLASFHERFAGRLDDVRARNPHLLQRDDADVERWRERACAALDRSDDGVARRLLGLLTRPGPFAVGVAGMPSTLLHGELYPSNVLVGAADGERAGIWPVDWEMAAIGPPAFDLAALVTGWDGDVRDRLVRRYRQSLIAPMPLVDLVSAVDACRLYLALQWLGWSPGWTAPAEHAHNWIGEALDAADRLGL